MTCLPQRIGIAPLAEALVQADRTLNVEEAKWVLYSDVNSPMDRDSATGKSVHDTIAAAEANAFIRKFYDGSFRMPEVRADAATLPRVAVATGLERIFFPGGLRQFPADRTTPVAIDRCHDGDTCTIRESPPDCPAIPARPIRLTGIDAPEVAGVPQPNGEISKLDENVEKVWKEWKAQAMWDDNAMAEAARPAIRQRIIYTGKLTALILNDLVRWLAQNGGRFRVRESQNRFTPRAGGNTLCGVWEPYDKYLRRLGTLWVEPPALLAEYLRARLPSCLTEEAMALYAEAGHIAGAPDAPPPTQLAAQLPAIAERWTRFAAGDGRAVAGDLGAWQVALGVSYEYRKYRHQYGGLFIRLGDAAREQHAGHWAEPTFATLYAVNARDPVYRPDDCLEAGPR